MKFLLLFLVGCAGMSEGTYKKKFHQEDFKSTLTPAAAHALLTEKMKKCYPQSDYPVYEKTVSEFDAVKQVGTVAYEIDNQSIGPQPLVLVEVEPDALGSIIKVYSKGTLFKAPTVYTHQIQKWIDGKKVDCDSHGQI